MPRQRLSITSWAFQGGMHLFRAAERADRGERPERGVDVKKRLRRLARESTKRAAFTRGLMRCLPFACPARAAQYRRVGHKQLRAAQCYPHGNRVQSPVKAKSKVLSVDRTVPRSQWRVSAQEVKLSVTQLASRSKAHGGGRSTSGRGGALRVSAQKYLKSYSGVTLDVGSRKKLGRILFANTRKRDNRKVRRMREMVNHGSEISLSVGQGRKSVLPGGMARSPESRVGLKGLRKGGHLYPEARRGASRYGKWGSETLRRSAYFGSTRSWVGGRWRRYLAVGERLWLKDPTAVAIPLHARNQCRS